MLTDVERIRRTLLGDEGVDQRGSVHEEDRSPVGSVTNLTVECA